MTNLRIRGRLSFLLGHSPTGNALSQLTLPTTICLVFLFCVVAAIPAPAQSVAFTSLSQFRRKKWRHCQALWSKPRTGTSTGQRQTEEPATIVNTVVAPSLE